MSLILASTSPIRRAMLDQAGVAYETRAPTCDEAVYKSGHEGTLVDLAARLAREKALSVSRQQPDDWVIGSDSVVSVAGRLFDKPADRSEAADHLRFFSGKTMQLHSAVALARGGEIDWQHGDSARLEVHGLDEDFIAQYLEAEWPGVAYCVGVFRMEGRGVTLFDTIEGSHFTILGMPLLPLLGALRARGEIA